MANLARKGKQRKTKENIGRAKRDEMSIRRGQEEWKYESMARQGKQGQVKE